MQIPSQSYEYVYAPNSTPHHHAYLTKPLFQLLPQIAANGTSKPTVLDLGCGDGSLSQKVAQLGYQVTGIEESTSGIQIARHNAPGLHFIQSSIYDLPETVLEQKFDVVMAAEVIEHLMYPRELLQTARKCLKPDGQLILTTPYHGYWKNLALALSGNMDQHFTSLWDGGHIKFFSISTLSTLLQSEGYTDIQFKFAGSFPYLWKSMLCSSILKSS